MFLLDTNIVSYLMRRDTTLVNERFANALRLDRQIAMSAIVFAELQFGVENAPSVKRRAQLSSELMSASQLVTVLEWPVTAATAHAVLRAKLKKAGQLIGFMDSLIAAHALAVGATLVTNNEHKFIRVPGLKVENWTKQ
jgi:tRNA(fMet)-specific endonuclease VapC